MKSRRKGFTLVELLAVIVVLGVILVLVAPTALSSFYKARATLNEMEQGIIIDAAKIYLTDLDKGKREYIYQGNEEIEVNGHKYKKGDKIKGYDLRVYIINNDGINVDVRTLVEGGYYDEQCSYEVEGYEGKPGPGCKVQEECVLRAKFNYTKSPDGVYYLTTGYEAEILNEGCKK